MAELHRYPRHERRFIDLFPSAYNALHGTSFAGQPERPGKLEQGWDYRWPDPDRPREFLEVQHTVAGSDQESERVHMIKAHDINHAVSVYLIQRERRGHHVTISAEHSPRSQRDLGKAIEYLCQAIDSVIGRGIAQNQSERWQIPWRTDERRGVYEVEVRNV